MADEPSLPIMPRVSTIRGSEGERPQKRVRLNSSPAISSDPPLFSSDDDPSADNYTRFRSKKQFRGPWYQQEELASDPASASQLQNGSKKGKRALVRQFDSGVFMGSDGTDSEVMDDDGPTERLQNGYFAGLNLREGRSSPLAKKYPTAEELAQRHIDLCLEGGNEKIDLTGQNITELSNETIRPLHAFACVPPVTQGVFARIEPKLAIFLASNCLRSLPEELFRLKHLEVLSLRANLLNELPPGIGHLQDLTELNLAQNKFQYLPFEILDLFSSTSRLQTFSVHPNIFFAPKFPDTWPLIDTRSELERQASFRLDATAYNLLIAGHQHEAAVSQDQLQRSWSPRWNVSFECRSQVRYTDTRGAHVKGPCLSSNTLFGPGLLPEHLAVADLGDVPVSPLTSRNLSRVPSLVEVALMSCSRTLDPANLHRLLPEPSPQHFPRLLEAAASRKESGLGKCTICKRNFIIPRTEWIEWWKIGLASEKEKGVTASAASPLRFLENDRDRAEHRIPLIRRGCSWLCVPGELALAKKDAAEAEDEQVETVEA